MHLTIGVADEQDAFEAGTDHGDSGFRVLNHQSHHSSGGIGDCS
jgi:hypothetical protein